MLYRGYTARHWVATIIFPTLQVPRVTNINFLLTISIHEQEKMSRELINWPPKGECCDLSTNSLHWFHKEKYGSQSGEFVCGYWGLKGQLSLTYRLHFDDHPFIWLCLKGDCTTPKPLLIHVILMPTLLLGCLWESPINVLDVWPTRHCVLFVFHDDHLVFFS